MTKPLDTPRGRAEFLQAVNPADATASHQHLRDIFQAEMAYRENDDDHDYFESIYHCAYLLFCVGDPSDVPAMWAAKHINMDTGTGFDIEFLLGAGRDATDAYLRANGFGKIAQELTHRGVREDELAEWSVYRQNYFYPQ